MNFGWNKDEPALAVEGNIDFDALKIAVRVQREPATDRLPNRFVGFSLLNSVMLRVGCDYSSCDKFVIGINCIESRFDRTVGSLKNDGALLVPLNVFKEMRMGFLQPILRPAGFTELCLLEVHDLFKYDAEQEVAASLPFCLTE